MRARSVATGAMIFNGAVLGEACVVALGGKVHVDTELAGGTWLPMGYAEGKPRAEVMDEIMQKYTRALGAHRADRVNPDGAP